ncbi:MAG: TetR/AcrR family transcriptional regulator [Pseudomonadota bacterium]
MKQTTLIPARGPYKKSEQSRERIIDAAIEQLIEEGYKSLTFRKIANRAEVSIGNLQHHFETKQKLIGHMLDVVIGGYIDEFGQMIQSTQSPQEQLRSVINTVVQDLTTRETTMFFPELWSMANHDPDVDELMTQMYERYMAVYHDIIARINPSLTPVQIERAALFIAATVEGHTIFIGQGKRAQGMSHAIEQMAFNSFLKMIEEGDIPNE